jgi:hypothetical protein
MSNLTVETASTEGGFNFLRSDRKRFFLVYKDDGSAVLYAGADRNTPPQTGIVSMDVMVSDKLNEAQRWVLAYPNRPSEAP